jgi:hypothetical protein
LVASVSVKGGERGGEGETGVEGGAVCADDTERKGGRGGEDWGHVADARNTDVVLVAHGTAQGVEILKIRRSPDRESGKGLSW